MILLITTVIALTALRLKENIAGISNESFPNYLISLSQKDMFNSDIMSTELKRISKDSLRDSLFKLQKSYNDGFVLKSLDGLKRSFVENNSLYFRSNSKIDDSKIKIQIKSVKYPNTFFIKNDKLCLEAFKLPSTFREGKGTSSKVILKFASCANIPSQRWGAFTEDQIRSYLKIDPKTSDPDEMTLKRLILELDKLSIE